MPTVTITEILTDSHRSGEGENGANAYFNLHFYAKGSTDEADLAEAIASSIPAFYSGLPLQTVAPNPLAPGKWLLTARYAPSQQQPPMQFGDPERITWQSVSSTVHRTHAPVVSAYDLSGSISSINGDAINVTDDGIEGVDIEFAISRLTIRTVITTAQASTAYGRTLAKLCRVKAVNDGPWRDFSAEEARFIDFSMDERGDGYWDLTRVFDVDEHVTGGTFAGIPGISKKAHEFMWAWSQRKEDATAKRVVQETISVSVHRVYPTANFNLLEP